MLDEVRRCFAESEPTRGGPREFSRVVCLNVGNGLVDGYCFLLFGGRDPSPLCVAKAARTAAGRAVFAAEYENLVLLDAAGLNATGVATPRPLGRLEQGSILVTLQSALPGRLLMNLPAARQFAPGRIASTLDHVLGWWRRFHAACGDRRIVLDGDAFDRHVLDPLRSFRRRFVLSDEEERFLERRYEAGRALHGRELPLVVRHGDFCTANMALRDDGIGVFDWEFPLCHHLPLFDLFFFFSSLRYPYAGLRGQSSHFASFVSVFWGRNYVNAALRARIGDVCRALDIAVETVGDLFLLALIDTANMKYEALLAANGQCDGPRAGYAPSRKERLARWDSFGSSDSDTPFACIRRGVSENVAHVVRHGLPAFDDPRIA